jgi:hypothetical protein
LFDVCLFVAVFAISLSFSAEQLALMQALDRKQAASHELGRLRSSRIGQSNRTGLDDRGEVEHRRFVQTTYRQALSHTADCLSHALRQFFDSSADVMANAWQKSSWCSRLTLLAD